MTVWSPQQEEALATAGAWLRMKWSQTFYLAGYAGTGKTTLAMHLASHANGRVAFAAFTGKAAKVMRSKGCEGASTIHKLIYWTEKDYADGEPTVTVTLKSKGDLNWCSLIVIDECSMVDEQLGKDLLSFDKPILVLGDPAQLPPVKGGGFFTSKTPNYMLTEVHRQAAESPILRLATFVREGGQPTKQIDVPGLVVVRKENVWPDLVTKADTVLVGKNLTRQRYNKRLREMRGLTTALPVKGETLICLRNDSEAQVSNGEIFTVADSVTHSKRKSIQLWLDGDDDMPTREVKVRKEFFHDDVEAAKMPFRDLAGTQQFTYGYAITCHKSQGSQWPNVCVFNEGFGSAEDRRRWLYTACTRASDHLTLVI